MFSWGTSNVADLNRDGYLDVVLGQFDPETPGQPQQLIIYYVSATDGGRQPTEPREAAGAAGHQRPDAPRSPEIHFDRSRRVAIPSPGRSIGSVIADFNLDAWLDIAVSSYEQDCVRVFWGGPKGFDAGRQLPLSIPSPIGMETADLNADAPRDVAKMASRAAAQRSPQGCVSRSGSD